MKKLMMLAVALLTLIGFTTAVFAADTESKVKGNIVSIDSAKNEVVIKDVKTGTDKKIIVAAEDIASLKKGDYVLARLKAGTNTARRIKHIKTK